jgi:hypothetical protein
MTSPVIPAKAGIQENKHFWTPAFAGVTAFMTFCEAVKIGGDAMSRCEKCSFRARYDKNPRSILGRMWKWHIGWCPGWKSYVKSLPEEKRKKVNEQYG